MAKVNNSVNNIFKNAPVTIVAASYTALPTDQFIEYSATAAAYTVTLPTGATLNSGKSYTIKDASGGAGTNNITVAPATGTIDGAASVVISSNYGDVQVYTDGANWFTMSSNAVASFVFNAVAGTTQTAASNNGYYIQNAALTTVTLPTVATTMVGKIIEVVGASAGGWVIDQLATQFINFGNSVTTVGTGGSLASTNGFDTVRLLAVSTTEWVVVASVGNLVVT